MKLSKDEQSQYNVSKTGAKISLKIAIRTGFGTRVVKQCEKLLLLKFLEQI
jgi:hypothetical protein